MQERFVNSSAWNAALDHREDRIRDMRQEADP
ncbi:MAG: hypothetical protein FD162_2369 [Rhodobacteraceae bacterium]|nr:MAG: hypothetical protein FD162_2369 [Paracoccaceae bacterium]